MPTRKSAVAGTLCLAAVFLSILLLLLTLPNRSLLGSREPLGAGNKIPESAKANEKPGGVPPVRPVAPQSRLALRNAVPELFVPDEDIRSRVALRHAKLGDHTEEVVSSIIAKAAPQRPLRMLGPSVPRQIYWELTRPLAGTATRAIAMFGEGRKTTQSSGRRSARFDQVAIPNGST